MKIKLEKINERGKKQFWNAEVIGNEITYIWGQEGGKFQEDIAIIKDGKNVGMVNETSPAEQAIFQAVNKARHKVDVGNYKVTEGKDIIEKYTRDTVVEIHNDVPKCMLAQVFQHQAKKFTDPNLLIDVQPKFDGNRMVCNVKTGKLYSRSRKEIIGVPHINEEIKKVFKNSKVTWIDGEVYSHEITFNEIQSIVRRSKDIDIETAKKIQFHVFDVITHDDWMKRKSVLEWFKKNIKSDVIKFADTYTIKLSELQVWHDKFVAEGYEGIMIRFHDGLYEGKRSMSLMKYKNFFDIEAVVKDVIPERNDSSKLGALEVEWEDKIFKARPAMTKEVMAKILKNKDEYIGKLATIRYQELDAKTGVPRFGVCKSFREAWDMDEVK